jgi:hypothetical protein
LQLYFFSELLSERTKRKSYSKYYFAVASAVNLFGSITTLVFTAALSFSHLVVDRRFEKWISWWIPTIILALFPLLYFYTLPGEIDPGKVTVSRFGYPVFFNAAYVIYGVLVGLTYGPSQEQLRGIDKFQVLLDNWLVLFVFVLVAFVLGFLVAQMFLQRNSKSKQFRLDCFFATLIVSSFVFGLALALVTKMNWVPRHSFYLWLPLSMLIPSILHGPYFKNKVKTYQFVLAKAVIISLIGLNIYSNFNYFFVEKYWRDDYRSVAQYLIQAQSLENKTALLFGSHNILGYYGDNQTIDANAVSWKLMDGEENWIAHLPQLVGNPSELILAVNREHALNRFASVEDALAESYQIKFIVDDFIYFRIYHLLPS